MRISKLALAVVGLSASVSAHGATVLISDTFTYADGSIAGQSPSVGGAWAVHSGAGGTPVNIASGQAILAQGSGSREDVNSTFAGGETGSAGEIFTATFDLSVADPGAAVQDTYFAHFLVGTSVFNGRTWVTAPAGATGYRIAVSGDSSIADNDGEVRSADLAFGQTYSITVAYNYDTGDSSLSIDGGAALTTTDGTFSDAINGFAFRQAAGNTTQTIDNLVVTVVVPEPATLTAIGGIAIAGLRRRR